MALVLVSKENAALSSCPVCKLEINPVLLHPHPEDRQKSTVCSAFCNPAQTGVGRRICHSISSLINPACDGETQLHLLHSAGGPDVFAHTSSNPSLCSSLPCCQLGALSSKHNPSQTTQLRPFGHAANGQMGTRTMLHPEIQPLTDHLGHAISLRHTTGSFLYK